MSIPSISVVVATFGDDVWINRAQRAIESATHQTLSPHEIIHIHGDTLAEARNQGAERAEADWLLFLDADDELDKGYVEAMDRAIRHHASEGRTFLFQPATLGIVNGVEDREPVVIPKRNLSTGNYMVIGTIVQRDQFLRVGGFWEWFAWEDWCLFMRCVADGATSVPVPEAIYRVHVNPNGRNEAAAGNHDLGAKIMRRHREWLRNR